MLSHAQAIACDSRFELMAGVDPAQDKRDLFVQKFHKSAYASLAELKGMDAPDIVVIATPTQTHAKMIDDLLSYVTPKTILCEKPLAYEFADAKQMVALCAEHKSALFVNFIRRTDPAIQTLKSMIQDGTLAGLFGYMLVFPSLYSGEPFLRSVQLFIWYSDWHDRAKSQRINFHPKTRKLILTCNFNLAILSLNRLPLLNYFAIDLS